MFDLRRQEGGLVPPGCAAGGWPSAMAQKMLKTPPVPRQNIR